MTSKLNVLAKNRLGFAVLGITNNFIYAIMLSAAFDLLNESYSTSSSSSREHNDPSIEGVEQFNYSLTNSKLIETEKKPYCNEKSTSTILLADTVPALAIKIVYPFLLISLPTNIKAIVTVLLGSFAFLITGLFTSQYLIFSGVVCASLAFGLGESTFMSVTPVYGDVSLAGWSIGTGAAGLSASLTYAVLRMTLSTKTIMLILLVVPLLMLIAYFRFITPLAETDEDDTKGELPMTITSSNRNKLRNIESTSSNGFETTTTTKLKDKLKHLRSLSKYFLPLLLVYFAEHIINQGMFELIYYPEINYLDHAAQFRWFLVSYNVGVLFSRSSIELIQLRNIWTMSILQFFNALLFLAHTSKLLHLPNFYLVVILIIYEGLLGGFTFCNAFYRVKKEVKPQWLEFSISTVSIADSLGIVLAGLLALPVHNSLCKLYN